MTDDVATDRVRSVWDRQARSWYEQRERMLAATRPVHEWLVDHLDPKPGQRVLEIAAGPGDTGFIVAPQLGNGRLVSTDLAPSMVEAARRRGAELGIDNADYEVLDAQAMRFDDASFDGAICRWGFMLMPDPAVALAECRRVLVPGGRLVFAVFTAPDENPFASIPARILIDAGHMPRPTSDWQPGILALGDRERLQVLLDASRFTSTQIEGVDMEWTFADADDYWTFLVDLTALGPFGCLAVRRGPRGPADGDRRTSYSVPARRRHRAAIAVLVRVGRPLTAAGRDPRGVDAHGGDSFRRTRFIYLIVNRAPSQGATSTQEVVEQVLRGDCWHPRT